MFPRATSASESRHSVYLVLCIHSGSPHLSPSPCHTHTETHSETYTKGLFEVFSYGGHYGCIPVLWAEWIRLPLEMKLADCLSRDSASVWWESLLWIYSYHFLITLVLHSTWRAKWLQLYYSYLISTNTGVLHLYRLHSPIRSYMISSSHTLQHKNSLHANTHCVSTAETSSLYAVRRPVVHLAPRLF